VERVNQYDGYFTLLLDPEGNDLWAHEFGHTLEYELDTMSPAPHSPARTTFRWLLGLLLMFAGGSHLTWARTDFQSQVPWWVPLNKDLVVILSGIVEIGLGTALVTARRRRPTVGWIVGAFFVAIFPGNLAQYQNSVDAFGLTNDRIRFVRLFFQPLLVLWALWSTGAWPRPRG
jgi:uncharacterized membrane protein